MESSGEGERIGAPAGTANKPVSTYTCCTRGGTQRSTQKRRARLYRSDSVPGG